MGRSITGYLILLLSISATSPLYAQQSIIDQMINTQPSVVAIKAEKANYHKSKPKGSAYNPHTKSLMVVRNLTKTSHQRYGAGVIVHPSGLIVTNAHNVAQANHVTVILDDRTEVAADIARFVGNIDLVLLKIKPPYPLTAVPIADSNQIRLGDEIITIGNSEFLKQTISGGKIIGLGKSRTFTHTGKKRTDLIQTTINLYAGDSGGPLFDSQGRLIGLMTAKETAADHSSFAIPSNQIAKYLLDYLKEQSIIK